MMHGRRMVLVIVMACLASSVCLADELQGLKDQLAAQENQLAELRQKVARLESIQDQAKPTLPESLKWAQSISLSGDLRYRHESIDQQDKPDRHRHRIRLRLNLSAKMNGRPERDLPQV